MKTIRTSGHVKFSRVDRWDFPSEMGFEVTRWADGEKSGWEEIGDGVEMPPGVVSELDTIFAQHQESKFEGKPYFEISVDVNVKGYHDPGQMSGPPERSYPPEGDEERVIKGTQVLGVVSGQKAVCGSLSESANRELEDSLMQQIAKTGVDYPDR